MHINHLRYDFPEDDQPRHAFILIKPGHFDMLYAKVGGENDEGERQRKRKGKGRRRGEEDRDR